MQASICHTYYGTLPDFVLWPLMPAAEFLEVRYSILGLGLVVGLVNCDSYGLAEHVDCLVRGVWSDVAYPPWFG